MSDAQNTWLSDFTGLDLSQNGAAAGSEQAGTATGGAAQDGQVGNIFTSVGRAIKDRLSSKPPVPRAALGEGQTKRAQALKTAMSATDQAKVDALLAGAKGDETAYLTKALASNHSATELETFYAAIKGKNTKWMEDNLHVVDSTSGTGVKQQWQMSCAPTTSQAVKAELDPIYALKLRTENPNLTEADDSDGSKKNPGLAAEQAAMLRSKGVEPTNRGVTGRGLSIQGVNDLMDQAGSSNGVSYVTKPVDSSNMDASLTEIDASLDGGLPVPMLVGDASGPKHSVLMTGVDPGPPRRYKIAAPGGGKSITVTEADIKADNLDIDGWTTITHFSKPTMTIPAPPTPAAAPTPTPTPAPTPAPP